MAEDTVNIKLRNLIIRDAYKDRYLKEKALEKEKERKNRHEISQRSAARFSSSPFSVNFIGLEEISEYRRKHDTKQEKSKKSSKIKRKTSETRDQKFLSKLRNEVRQIENSTFHIECYRSLLRYALFPIRIRNRIYANPWASRKLGCFNRLRKKRTWKS